MGLPHRVFLILTKPAAGGSLQKIFEPGAVKIGHKFPYNRLVRSFCRSFGDNILHNGNGNAERIATLLTSGKVIFEFTQATKMIYFLGTEDHPDEIAVVNLLMRTVREGDIFFDVGANVGFFTFLAAPLCGRNGSVHAFEPNPNLVPNLIRSADLNQNFSNIIINSAALGEKDGGEIQLYFSSDIHDIGVTSTYPHPWLNSKSKITVPLLSIDAYMKDKNLIILII